MFAAVWKSKGSRDSYLKALHPDLLSTKMLAYFLLIIFLCSVHFYKAGVQQSMGLLCASPGFALAPHTP